MTESDWLANLLAQMQKGTQGCDLVVMCVLGALMGAVTTLIVGHITFVRLTYFASERGFFYTNPLEYGGDTVGESFGLLFTVLGFWLLCLISGCLAGIFAGAQFIRFTRRKTPQTVKAISRLMLLNAMTTFLDVSSTSRNGQEKS